MDKVIELEVKESDYQKRINAMKIKSSPPGGVESPEMPDFHNLPKDPKADERNRAWKEKMGIPSEDAKPSPDGYVVRKGADGGFVNPPRPPGSGLSEETKAGLKQLTDEIAKVAVKEEKDKDEEEKEEIDTEIDIDLFGRRFKTLLRNKTRRDEIEKRCEPLSLEDLLIHQELRQVVPIVPKKFYPTFRTMSGSEQLYCKKRVAEEPGFVTDEYLAALHSILELCCGLSDINGRPLTHHISDDGGVDEEKFKIKYNFVKKYPISILADLSTNFIWFNERVQRLSIIEQLKGF